jgi:hypothetical protein
MIPAGQTVVSVRGKGQGTLDLTRSASMTCRNQWFSSREDDALPRAPSAVELRG